MYSTFTLNPNRQTPDAGGTPAALHARGQEDPQPHQQPRGQAPVANHLNNFAFFQLYFIGAILFIWG